MKKQYAGNCVDNPFKTVEFLSYLIDESREITKTTFLKHCDVEIALKREMTKFPYDFTFYKHQNIYFYTHSMIEHFYI